MTSQHVYEHMKFLILARKMKQNRKHAISWFWSLPSPQDDALKTSNLECRLYL